MLTVRLQVGILQLEKGGEIMLKMIKRMLCFSGARAGKLKIAFVLSFFENMFATIPIFLALLIFTKIIKNTLQPIDAWVTFGGMLLLVVLRCILRRAFVSLESGSGYEICADERLDIGNRLKHFPMGYFTEGSIGNITSAITVDLLFVETYGMSALDKVINGYLNMAIGTVTLLIIDWKIAVISIVTCLAAMVVLNQLQKLGKEQSEIKQRQQSFLTSSVLEYIKGISVIKAFNIEGERAQNVKEAIRSTRDHAIEYEEKFIPPNTRYLDCFSFGIAMTVFSATSLALYGHIQLSLMIMIVIYMFYFYKPIQALSDLTNLIRVMEASLNRYEDIKGIGAKDKEGKDIELENYDIKFKNVSFSYGDNLILNNISFSIPEKSMTALVGMSGAGKTTIANLIVRFWDADSGTISVGGIDVKEMSYGSLLNNISMVFQKVYLFHDTIRNNIKFGKPDATDEEIIQASKKARCHDFIMELKDGYDTVIEAGGGSLSGGEQQRISIARAILKDAPIILLDEATASVDPDNEMYIQMAISELVKNKTLVIIAHRLSTICSADQILVIDNGMIAESGKHSELIVKNGIYKKLWDKRTMASSWKIEY